MVILAIIYVAAMIYFGDRICRCFIRFISVQHRFAISFLVGLLTSAWTTYLGALAFYWSPQPLIMGNIVFILAFMLAVYKLPRRPASNYLATFRTRTEGSTRWDWICLGACLIFACWLMFGTLGFKDGAFQIAFKAWADFGANLSLAQSFVLGRNFPTQHPYFPGELIRYHFLFWFQAGNLEFLGLNLVWSVNLLSILSLVALLILIMTLAEILFDSRVVGRLAALLFFFSSSLSYIPFLRAHKSLSGAVSAIRNSTNFLASGYPFRGEDWGALTVDVFAIQRHLISGVGLFLVVLIFLVDRYQYNRQYGGLEANAGDKGGTFKHLFERAGNAAGSPPWFFGVEIKAFIFAGILIGALPLWNSAAYVSALIVLGCTVLLFPYRLYTGVLVAVALLVGLPQVLLLSFASAGTQSLFHWGYTLADPTFPLVLRYVGWTFGFKWLLILVALLSLSATYGRWFIACSSLLVAVFLFQLSTDVFNNHKLLNVWTILANCYAAYALWRIGRVRIIGPALAVVLTLATVLGGFIDLFPVHNDLALSVAYENDRLGKWLLTDTRPADVFLTHTLLTHQILFAGRKIFLGYTLFAWSAGYKVTEREIAYRRMFQERDPAALVRLLNQSKIAYVVIDDDVRSNKAIQGLNESVFQEHFPKVFEDTGHQYANLTIFKVPTGDQLASQRK
jgi:hypothetical protein